MEQELPFSKRYGHKPEGKNIVIREDAPKSLRVFVIQTLYYLKYEPSDLRKIICRVLRVSPDPNNWSEYPNIDSEVNYLMETCEWYRVYDLIEEFYGAISAVKRDTFEIDVNDFFLEHGIGWKLVSGKLEARGDDSFESAVHKVSEVLEEAELKTAKGEISEAIKDLSRRPKPDITGAIQHSLACLECVYREVTGDRNATLGELSKKYTSILPKPIPEVVSKIWGYTSEQGRHLREGNEPEYIEAELVVELTAAISTYLGKKIVDNKPQDDY